jgi:phage terminase small subunit
MFCTQCETLVLKPLTPKEQTFVAEYLVDHVGWKAAVRAGYSENGATSYAALILARPHVQAAYQKALQQRLSRVGITADTVMQEMSLLALSSIDDHGQVKLAEGAPEGAMRAIQSIKRKIVPVKSGGVSYEVEIKLWDKPTPLKLMGKQVQLFPDKVEVTGKGGGPVETLTKIERVIVKPGDKKE